MNESELDIPPEFFCPITLGIMKNPILMPDGQTYERDAIKRALSLNPISPITRQQMKMDQGITNYALKSLIEKFIQDHPSIKFSEDNQSNELPSPQEILSVSDYSSSNSESETSTTDYYSSYYSESETSSTDYYSSQYSESETSSTDYYSSYYSENEPSPISESDYYSNQSDDESQCNIA